jgi:hypothetical protein
MNPTITTISSIIIQPYLAQFPSHQQGPQRQMSLQRIRTVSETNHAMEGELSTI